MRRITALLALLPFFSHGQTIDYVPLHTSATFDAVTIDVSKPVGSTSGQAGVSPTGGATYAIPVYTPPGTNGVVPSVSLEYNSQAGPGIAGMGWHLSGMSAISRVPQNVYFDGQVRPVGLNADDRFALDGQRLVLKTGTYGATGSTYGTEVENFATVTLHAVPSSSLTWLEVVTKEGIKMEYGRTADSRFLNEAETSVIFWALNRLVHPDGNYIDYQYTATGREEPRLTKILYTGNLITEDPAYNEIQFDYKIRQEGDFSDIRTVYIGGSEIVSRFLLDKITVKAEGTNTRVYELTYGHDGVNSYLKSVQEGNGGGATLNPTVFKYGDVPVLRTEGLTSIPQTGTALSLSGDYNGDGLPELLTAAYTESNGIEYISEFKVWKKEADPSMTYSQIASQSLPASNTIYYGKHRQHSSLLSMDFDGDGADDVLVLGAAPVGPYALPHLALLEIKLYKSVPGSPLSFQVQNLPISTTNPEQAFGFNPEHNWIQVGDFNGDGKLDYLLILLSDPGPMHRVFIAQSSSGGWTTSEVSGSGFSIPLNTWHLADEIHKLDFDGDGKDDLLLTKDGVCEIFRFNGASAVRIFDSSSALEEDKGIHLGDFNGDGKIDLLNVDGDFSTIRTLISTGTSIQVNTYSFDPPWPNNVMPGGYSEAVTGDFNGDGKTDVFREWIKTRYEVLPEGAYTHDYRGKDIYYSIGDGFRYVQVSYSHTIDGPYEPNFAPNEPNVIANTPSAVTVHFSNLPADLNGDGKTDLIFAFGNHLSYQLFNLDGRDNRLEKVKTGTGHQSQWEYGKTVGNELFFNNNFYTPTFPLTILNPAWILVKNLTVSNGSAGTRTFQYGYNGATFHRQGKGFLGFGRVRTSDLAMGTMTTSDNEFSTGYFAGVPYQTTLYTGLANQVSQTTLTNVLEPAGAKRFWLKTNSISQTDDLSGVTTTTGLVYDAYANVTQQTVTIPGVHTTVTDTDYGAYPSGIPNKPTLVTVTQTRSGETPFETKTKLDYNGLGQLTSKIDFYQQAKAVTTTFGYNGLGNQTSTTVSATGIPPRSTGAVYDDKGRYPLQTSNALSQPSTATYDPKWGTPLTVAGVDGRTTSYQYDTWGQLTKTTFPEGYETDATLHWDVSGQQRFYAQSVTAGMPTTRTWYDLLEREIRTETEGFNGDLSIQTQSYDARGNVHVVSEPHYNSETHHTTTHLYDAYNRISSVQHSALGTTGYGYSYASGRQTVTTTSPTGITTQTTDAAGMLTSATDHGGTLNYTYYSHGGLKTTANGGVTLTSATYDAYGRQTGLTDVNAGTTEYEYDALGQLIWQKTAGNDETTMAYNLLGQVTTRTGVEGITTYAYGTDNGSGDIKNRIKTVTGFAGTSTAYTYNELGQLTQLTEHNNGAHTTGYTYNAVGDISTVSYPSGLVITNQYNVRGYLDEIKQGGTTLYKTEATNGQGQVTQYKRQNNLLTSTIAYTNSFPTAYTTAGIQDYQLTWDYQKGTLTSRQDARTAVNKTETFTYDNLQRLTGASVSGGAPISATYHAGGNLNTKTDAGVYTYHPTKIHAVTGVTNPAPAPIPTLQQDITYTPFLQPETVEEGDFELIYTYGADYNRAKSELKQSGNTINTRYYYEAGYERDITGSTTRYIQYIASPAGLVAIIESTGGSHTVHYTFTDHLGSILTVTNNSGSIEAEQSFDAWGRRRNPTSWELLPPTVSTGLPVWLYRGYTAHEQLDQFGLINMNGRMHDPVLGRMLSPDNYILDPLSTQDYNRYTYARNNPLLYTDPDGDNPIVFIVAGLIGGGHNLWSNWSKVKDFKTGLGYFASGAVGGVVSVVNPLLGGGITASGNVALDIVTGNTPDFSDGWEVTKYAGGVVLDGFGASISGGAAKGLASTGLLGLSAKNWVAQKAVSYTFVGTQQTLSKAELSQLAAQGIYPSTNIAAGVKRVADVGGIAAKTSSQILSWGKNSKGHLIKHADALGFGNYSPQQLQKMLPELRGAANQLLNNANPALTRVGQWHGHQNATMYISNGRMLVTEANGTFITVINKTSNQWYNAAKAIK